MRILKPITLPDGRLWRGRFDGLTRLLHWLTVAIVTFQLASGLSFDALEGTPSFPLLLMLHRTAGVALWLITLLRLYWRSSFATFPPFPVGLPHLMQWAAKLTEYALYGLLLLQPLSGLADTLLRGRPFALFLWTIPKLLPRQIEWSLFAHHLHEWGVWALMGVAGLHALAALFHHLVLKDDVLKAMLP